MPSQAADNDLSLMVTRQADGDNVIAVPLRDLDALSQLESGFWDIESGDFCGPRPLPVESRLPQRRSTSLIRRFTLSG
jgi:hypothetical protein